MRSRDRVKKGSGGESGNGAQLGAPPLVSDAEGSTVALRRRGREFAAEDFAKIILLLFDCPDFQVDAAPLFGE